MNKIAKGIIAASIILTTGTAFSANESQAKTVKKKLYKVNVLNKNFLSSFDNGKLTFAGVKKNMSLGAVEKMYGKSSGVGAVDYGYGFFKYGSLGILYFDPSYSSVPVKASKVMKTAIITEGLTRSQLQKVWGKPKYIATQKNYRLSAKQNDILIFDKNKKNKTYVIASTYGPQIQYVGKISTSEFKKNYLGNKK